MLSEVQGFPVTIGSLPSEFEILNAMYTEACVDESRSEILRWHAEDGRPDKVGRYRMISNLTVDSSRVNNRHIFRVKDWEVALIVSEKVSEALQSLPNLGIVFSPVC